MQKNSIRNKLRNRYFSALIPAIILIGFVYLLKYINPDFGVPNSKLSDIVLITFSALSSVGLPIFYRTWFINKVKNKKSVSSDNLTEFEKNTISAALLSPYILALAVILNAGQIYITMISFISIYAAYYYFPSEKKVRFEKKLFRTKEESDGG